jgi:hypothetical protein
MVHLAGRHQGQSLIYCEHVSSPANKMYLLLQPTIVNQALGMEVMTLFLTSEPAIAAGVLR